MSAPLQCVACGEWASQLILQIASVPALCNELCFSRAAALEAKVASIDLVSCARCGHTYNAAFDPGVIDYGPDYENSLHFSPRFREYSTSLISSLAARYNLAGRNIVEVGCGSGEFLMGLCKATGAHGFGFDPSYNGPSNPDGRSTFTTESFFESGAIPSTALLCNRHVLEHVESPRSFVSAIADKLHEADATALYLEVPNGLYTLRDLGIWDIIYEHPSYFCATSLAHVVRAAGFDVQSVEESFGGQFLGLHGRLAQAEPSTSAAPVAKDDAPALAEVFGEAYRQKTEEWRTTLAALRAQERGVALWSAGSKGSSFLNVLDAGDTVQFVVDVNPKKQGKFMAGTGHAIVAPDAVRNSEIDTVILMNPMYEGEVRSMLDELRPGVKLLLA